MSCAGVVGLVTLTNTGRGVTVAAMAAAVHLVGAVCVIAMLAFRLTVVPLAAERTVKDGGPPEGFAALDQWAGSLSVVHMAAAYLAFAILGASVALAGDLPGWVGWLGLGWGLGFLVGFVSTRFAGPFNPPFWAHTYTGLIGVMHLMS